MRLGRISMTLLMSFCLCGFLLFSISSPRHTLAASNPITFTAQTYNIHFPSAIDFTVQVDDAKSTIYKAAIYITIGTFAEQHIVTPSTPKNSLALSWHEDTSGGNFHPPGTMVNYYWQLMDSGGNTSTSVTQEFKTFDTRFAWQHLNQGLLQVNWYNRTQDFGQIMLNQASASIEQISSALGGGLIEPINLWIYETTGDFQGSLAPNSYEWVGGQALPALNEASIAVSGTNDDTLIRDMPHELTHLVFHQRIRNGIYAPTWFDEGLAVFNQTYHEEAMINTFNFALARHSLLRLKDLEKGFPSNPDKAYLAYAQSWQLVSYMYSTFGQVRMALLIQKMDQPQTDFDEDLKSAVGEDQVHLENSWRLHLHQPAVLGTVRAPLQTEATQAAPDSTTVVLIGAGILLILGSMTMLAGIAVAMRRRNKAPIHST